MIEFNDSSLMSGFDFSNFLFSNRFFIYDYEGLTSVDRRFFDAESAFGRVSYLFTACYYYYFFLFCCSKKLRRLWFCINLRSASEVSSSLFSSIWDLSSAAGITVLSRIWDLSKKLKSLFTFALFGLELLTPDLSSYDASLATVLFLCTSGLGVDGPSVITVSLKLVSDSSSITSIV